ncbi:zinc finger protein chinmo isoform X2 [Chrysoperla carnea]|nr:zinc finger protein chinmo isoform X2 [Chrysoperla carnea]XP_044744085.1 zinc finger protein chinmo isoform X2 [Chrysoperla carnea]
MDSQQQFCLKWNSFGSNLATSFSNLFKSESLADVTLFCEGVSFRAHKLILAACSKHLADLFETAPLFQNVLVILDGTSAANMSALLEFMYKGEVHVSQESLSSFLKAAEYLQVKGLSIEHEKLAAQSQHGVQDTSALDSPTSRPKHGRLSSSGSKEDCGDTPIYHPVPSPSSSYPTGIQSYMQPPYRNHEQRVNSQSQNNVNQTRYDECSSQQQRKQQRPLRSPNEMLQEAAALQRASVLRDGSILRADGSKQCGSRSGSPNGGAMDYRPSSSSSSSLPPGGHKDSNMLNSSDHNKYGNETPEGNNGSSTTGGQPTSTFDRTAVVKTEQTTPEHRRHSGDDASFPEDLRMKMDTTPSSGGGNQQDEQTNMVTNSTGSNIVNSSGNNGGRDTGNNYLSNGTAGNNNGSGVLSSPGGGGQNAIHIKYDCDRDTTKITTGPDGLLPNIWQSVGKLSHKAGSVTTPDGKKLKCPFCERLYGYETNLRAHIRQRHQGIRVPCPFCSRTFTRNNTVRRHIAREHKTELSLKTFQQTQQAAQQQQQAQQVHNNHNTQ